MGPRCHAPSQGADLTLRFTHQVHMSTLFNHKSKPMIEEGLEENDTPAKGKAGPDRKVAIQACNPQALEYQCQVFISYWPCPPSYPPARVLKAVISRRMEDSGGPAALSISWSLGLYTSITLPDALSISRASATPPQEGWLTPSWQSHLLICMEAATTQPLPPAGREGAWLTQSQMT